MLDKWETHRAKLIRDKLQTKHAQSKATPWGKHGQMDDKLNLGTKKSPTPMDHVGIHHAKKPGFTPTHGKGGWTLYPKP